MTNLQELVVYICFGVALCALVSFFFLVFLYRRKDSLENSRLEKTKADIADMTILFQTMRDIISQQKEMAKHFNAELENKMSLVKQVLQRGMEKNERLYEKQHAINLELDESREKLESLQRQMTYLQDSSENIKQELHEKKDVLTAPIQQDDISPEKLPPSQPEPEPVPQLHQPPPRPNEEKSPPTEPLHKFGTLPEEVLSETAFTQWVGLSLEEDTPDDQHAEEEVLDSLPISAEDSMAARDAFRALLDLDNAQQQQSPGAQQGTAPFSAREALTNATPPPQDNHATGGNGSVNTTPLQQKVLEYSDAGMTVPEISRELGIGKGEVRLILSLAKQHKS
jgi:predicted transcriptional regulator